MRETCDDMLSGYRIHHGDHATQKWYLQLESGEGSDETKYNQRLIDFDRESIPLPVAEGVMSPAFDTVLQNTDAGMVLKCDDNFTLWGKRLCQSRVFAFTSFGENENTEVSIQMAREEDVPLFSYAKFFEAWWPFAKRLTNSMPDCYVQLSFGRKPRHHNSKVFITAKLIPKAAAALMEIAEQICADHCEERMISDNKSLDDIIRLFTPENIGLDE